MGRYILPFICLGWGGNLHMGFGKEPGIKITIVNKKDKVAVLK